MLQQTLKISFLKNKYNVKNPSFITEINENILNKVGEHEIELSGNNRIYKMKLTIQDTVKPEITLKVYTYYIGDKIDPLKFIDIAKDSTTITAKIQNAVDLTVEGEHEVSVDYLQEEGIEVIYLPRTPEISTTRIKSDLQE